MARFVFTNAIYWTLVFQVSTQHFSSLFRGTRMYPTGRRNLTNSPGVDFEIKIRREQRKLEIQRQICNIIGSSSCGRNRTAPVTPKPVKPTRYPVLPKEIQDISPVFSEPTNRTNDTHCMEFRLSDTYFRSNVELSGADVYVHIKIKKRRKRKRRRNIVLRISRLTDDTLKRKTIARLRFQPTDTRWYKVALPVTLIRKLNHFHDRTLKLCIQCKKCNRKMRITFPLTTSRGKKKKSRKSKKKSQRRKTAYRNLKVRRLRLRKNRPFLIFHVKKRFIRRQKTLYS